MTFTTADHIILSRILDECHQIMLRVTAFQSRSGIYQMDEQFEQYLTNFLKKGT